MTDALLPAGYYWVDRGNGPQIAKLAIIESGGTDIPTERLEIWAYCGLPFGTEKAPTKIIGPVADSPEIAALKARVGELEGALKDLLALDQAGLFITSDSAAFYAVERARAALKQEQPG